MIIQNLDRILNGFCSLQIFDQFIEVKRDELEVRRLRENPLKYPIDEKEDFSLFILFEKRLDDGERHQNVAQSGKLQQADSLMFLFLWFHSCLPVIRISLINLSLRKRRRFSGSFTDRSILFAASSISWRSLLSSGFEFVGICCSHHTIRVRAFTRRNQG